MTPFVIFGTVSAIFASLFCLLCFFCLIGSIVNSKDPREENGLAVFLLWVVLFAFSVFWVITAIFLIIA